MSENRTVWKSNNQGFKEATFIETMRGGGRGGDTEMVQRGKETQCGMERQAAKQALAAPHSCVVDKNQEGYLGSEQSQPQARPHSTGFRDQEHKSP